MSERPKTSLEIEGAVRFNLCHDNCVCSDSGWCAQELAANEIARLRAAVPDWQPIASVPHDTDVQIASGDVVTSGLFECDGMGGGFWHIQDRLEDFFASNPPTHWMPLSASLPQS